MGGFYKPRKNTIEYVIKTEEFVKYTIHLMMNLPNEWRDFLTTPVAEAVLAIENCVEKANAVYIQKPGTRAELPKYYAALRERRNYSSHQEAEQYHSRLYLNKSKGGEETQWKKQTNAKQKP